MPEPTPPDPTAVIGQLLTFAGKLAGALEDSEVHGGLAGLREKMRSSTFVKLVDELTLLRSEIDVQLKGLTGPKQQPAKRRPAP